MVRWRALGWAFALSLLLAAPAGAQSVTVYGADWCGACRKLKSHLQQRGVRYTWLDIGFPANKAAMHAAGGGGSIPFWIIGDKKGVGFPRGVVDAALRRAGALGSAPRARPGKKRSKTKRARYGKKGKRQPAAWWRARALKLHRRIAQLVDALADHAENGESGLYGDDKEAMLKRQLQKTQRRLRRLERDAREARVPRKYLEAPAGVAVR